MLLAPSQNWLDVFVVGQTRGADSRRCCSALCPAHPPPILLPPPQNWLDVFVVGMSIIELAYDAVPSWLVRRTPRRGDRAAAPQRAETMPTAAAAVRMRTA